MQFLHRPSPKPTQSQNVNLGVNRAIPGSTRKGFNRIDRIEKLIPTHCQHCGSNSFEDQPVFVKVQQVAQLVARLIEVVEYHQLRCRCHSCGQESSGAWPNRVIPGQDLDAGLQALLGWLGCYGQISYEKQAQLLGELGLGKVGVGTVVNINALSCQNHHQCRQ